MKLTSSDLMIGMGGSRHSYQLSAVRSHRTVGLFSALPHSALSLFTLRVGWFERSETQHNPCKPVLL